MSQRVSLIGMNEFLREKRVESGFTQMEAAKHIGHKTPQYISNYERGLCEPSPRMAKKLGKLFGVTTKEIETIAVENYARAIARALAR